MKPIKSLEEIRECGRKWTEAPTKTIRAISQKEILNLYTAANKFVPDRLRHYARLYGFPNYKRASVRCLHHAVGRCGNDNHIDIDFLYVLFADHMAFDTLLLHELCHTEFHNYDDSFWMLLDKTLKKASIIGPDDDSRRQWLRLVVFNKDNLQTILPKGRNEQCVDAFGGWYKNVSAIKRGVIRRKICTDSLCNGLCPNIEPNLSYASIRRKMGLCLYYQKKK